MARVTVEDCVLVVPNRFELCLIANNRAKSILSGASTALDEKEKPSVIALREIAEGMVDIEKIRHNITESTKNKSVMNDQVQENTSQIIAEETEAGSSNLKDNIFLSDNLEVED